MKRILIAALAAIVAMTGFTEAYASPGNGAQMRWQQVFWRSHAATQTDANAFGDLGYKDAVDSLVTNRLGVASAAGVLDTTAAISTDGWGIPNYVSVADSGQVYATALFYESTDTTSNSDLTADSLYIVTQVSPDKSTWVNATIVPVAGQVPGTFLSRTIQVTTNAIFQTATSMNNTASRDGAQVFRLVFKTRPPGGGPVLAVNTSELYTFPYVRFIVYMHKANVLRLSCKLGYWQVYQP